MGAQEVSQESITEEVQALLGSAHNSDLTDQNRARLEQLRARFRESPTLFDSATIASLREVAAVLKCSQQDRSTLPPHPSPSLAVLQKVFGYESFRPGQAEIVEAIIAGRDCLGIMPTGAGKSVTYQIPARVLGGVTLVISPLISLMKDQVDSMTEVGIRATFLNSSIASDERERRITGLRAGEYELVYASPEGLDASVGRILDQLDLRLIAVDEAHCISQWGHDFRPSYRNLAGLKARFGGLPLLALTGTATPQVKRDILEQLGMRDPLEVRGSFFRPNLKLHAYKKGGSKNDSEGVRERILKLLRSHRGESAIVYCMARKTTEAFAEYLRKKGISAVAYHAGLDAEERTRRQDAFNRDDVDVICATLAFGMGIDKSNVRLVIHRDMPKTLEGYYQEIGRAGRDSAHSDCVLFYSWADVIAFERLLSDEDPELLWQQKRALRAMFDFAEAPGCRWSRVVRHFAESLPSCGSSCDHCAGTDILKIAATATPVSATAASTAAPHSSSGVRSGAQRSPRDPEQSNQKPEFEADADPELLEKLKKLRRTIANRKNVPAYVVFSDRTLIELAARRPSTSEQMMQIYGIGAKKWEQYGEVFLETLSRS